jgi:acetoacetate decarboxylase
VLTRDGDGRVHGSVTRQGVTFIEMTGRVTDALPAPAPYSARQFWFKFSPAVDGTGFDGDPLLIRFEQTRRPETLELVEGELILRDLAGCPVVDLPVRGEVTMTWVVRASENTPKIVGPVDPAAFSRYVPIRYQ